MLTENSNAHKRVISLCHLAKRGM